MHLQHNIKRSCEFLSQSIYLYVIQKLVRLQFDITAVWPRVTSQSPEWAPSQMRDQRRESFLVFCTALWQVAHNTSFEE